MMPTYILNSSAGLLNEEEFEDKSDYLNAMETANYLASVKTKEKLNELLMQRPTSKIYYTALHLKSQTQEAPNGFLFLFFAL